MAQTQINKEACKVKGCKHTALIKLESGEVFCRKHWLMWWNGRKQ